MMYVRMYTEDIKKLYAILAYVQDVAHVRDAHYVYV